MKCLKSTLVGLSILSTIVAGSDQLFAQKFSVELQGILGKSSVIDSRFESNRYVTQQKFKALPSSAFGLAFNWNFSEHLSLSVGLQRSNEGANRRRIYTYEDANQEVQIFTQNIDFLYTYNRIPININYHFRNSSKQLRPVLSVGVNYGWVTGYDYKLKDVELSSGPYLYYSPGNEFGLSGFGGLRYGFLKNFSITVGISAYRGLINVEQKNSFFDKDYIKNTNLRGMLSVAYSF